MKALVSEMVLPLGANKSRPNTNRIWCQSQVLNNHDFKKGIRYNVTYDLKRVEVIIEANEEGERVVSGTIDRPIIDIENITVRNLFDGIKYIHVAVSRRRIVVSASDRAKMMQSAKRKAQSGDLTFNELYAGGGTLSESLRSSGMGYEPVCAVDMDIEMNAANRKKAEGGKYHSMNALDTYRANFPECKVIQAPVNQLDMKKHLPKAGLLVAGIPCQSASKQGITKRKKTGAAIKDEALPQLVFPVLEAVVATEPHTVLIEQVDGFMGSYSRVFLSQVLADFGYEIHESFVDGKELNGMTKRRRFVMVATVIKNFAFDFETLESKTFESILEGETEDHKWSAFEQYKERQRKNLAEGRNFIMQICEYSDTITGTFGAGYKKGRVSEPILRHPDHSVELYRQFTAREIARIHGIADSYVLPQSETAACHVLGNGVWAEGWRQVACSIATRVSCMEKI